MAAKYYSAYDAACRAAELTDGWKMSTGDVMYKSDLLACMSTADEEQEIEKDGEFYYIVSDDGAIGVTVDAERTVDWIAEPLSLAKKKKKFCRECGGPVDPDAAFCEHCGSKIPHKQQENTPARSTKTASRDERPHGNVGYSSVINTPEFAAAVKRQRRNNRGCALVFIFAPLIAGPVYAIISGEIEFVYGLFLGAVASAVLFLLYFVSTLRDRLKKPWEGVVERRYTKQVRVTSDRNVDDRDARYETRYYIVVRKDGGGKEKIEEKDSTSFSYFKEGDRIRYHGKLGLPYPYEKYDKSHDDHVICAFCRADAPITADKCPKCKNPILR